MAAVPDFNAANDPDTLETQEWLEALETVLEREGPERAHFLLEKLIDKARRSGAHIPYDPNTSYINTIPPHMEARSPGDAALEERIRSYCRWNAMVMVAKANKGEGDLGGHIASFASLGHADRHRAAPLLACAERRPRRRPDLLPGPLRAGRLRARCCSRAGSPRSSCSTSGARSTARAISSYPHPWLMPDFWQFPTVSMGLGPIQAIYQARYLKYLHARGLASTENRKVWAFLGDGETDEPETLGAIWMASREKLDNLIFVINCNLQRLDGPVHGNGKIIQDLEGEFRGAGWNVIKLVWGSYWDPLLARDKEGILLRIMEETVDGEYQNYKANDGAFVRKHFFGKHPKLLELVSRLTDQDIWRLNRGGHDPHKIYAAYHRAVNQKDQPTVILAKTIKGYGMGRIAEGRMTAHQQKKMDMESIQQFRDRFNVPIPDDKIEDLPFYVPPPDAPEMKYLHERRQALGGYLPQRRRKADTVPQVPPLDGVRAGAEGPGARDLDDDGVRARADRARARQEPRQVRRADRPRRGAHLRHGGHVPAARHLLVRGAEVHAAGQGPGDVLPRGQGRPDPRGGHQRGGRLQLVDRRGDQLQRVERADGAVLHLLLDVRAAAHRRSRVGGGRPARPRLPPRRHRRPHHAERRGAAARGRPQPRPVVGDPELRLLRPDVRLRGRRDHPRRPAADGDEPGGRLLLHHRDERELRASGDDRRPPTRMCRRAS